MTSTQTVDLNQLARRKAKIIATLGPASSSVAMIHKLILAGVDVARVNMSHGTHETHAQLIQNIRDASKLAHKEIAVLLDLQGPKIRVSKLPSPLTLVKGEHWVIVAEKDEENVPDAFSEKIIPTTYEAIVKDVKTGAQILFDDGLLEAVVTKVDSCCAHIEVIVGGLLKSNKGINLPNVKVSAPSMTEKDYEDLVFGIKAGADYVALSFVRDASDILHVRSILEKQKLEIPIISKIEKPEALQNIQGILDVTDLVMIARGDMGVEVGNHLVPAIQKNLIAQCNARGVPVITATQMLESMITNSRPTRAEASDVANSIWDGTDAVMLSAESASGQYPVEAVEMMDKIVREAELTPKDRPFLRNVPVTDITSANQVAASLIAEKLGARWIVSLTERGRSCLKMTKFRPRNSVLGLTASLKTLRRMNLYWGIVPYFVSMEEDDTIKFEMRIFKQLMNLNMLALGDTVVVTHGDGNYFKENVSNSIRTEIIKD
jgi:pyruvate kinase